MMDFKQRRLHVWFLLLLFPLVIGVTIWRYPLWAIDQLVRFKFDVTHLTSQALSNRLHNKTNQLIVFDVRKPEEFAVSHLQGAIQIDPDMDAATFRNTFADQIQGKELVFYCSAGYRSSQFAERLTEEIPNATFNLSGGIFRWYNQGHPVYNQDGPVNDVHPYSDRFKRMIDQRD
jgi:rhodanese-related sulfurtransferase